MRVQLKPTTLDHLGAQPSRSFDWIGFDPIDDCNLHCIYCHNGRTKKTISPEEFGRFMREKVDYVHHVQFGCAMEPTLQPELERYFDALAEAGQHPPVLMIQTNGTLLHRHDTARMVEQGLTQISVSIDTTDPETFRQLRGGAKLEKVMRNIAGFREKHPEVPVCFVPTVNKANIHQIRKLIDDALAIGVRKFSIREMFHMPLSPVIDHDMVRSLALPDGAFAALEAELREAYGDSVGLGFVADKSSRANRLQVQLDSNANVPVGVIEMMRADAEEPAAD